MPRKLIIPYFIGFLSFVTKMPDVDKLKKMSTAEIRRDQIKNVMKEMQNYYCKSKNQEVILMFSF